MVLKEVRHADLNSLYQRQLFRHSSRMAEKSHNEPLSKHTVNVTFRTIFLAEPQQEDYHRGNRKTMLSRSYIHGCGNRVGWLMDLRRKSKSSFSTTLFFILLYSPPPSTPLPFETLPRHTPERSVDWLRHILRRVRPNASLSASCATNCVSPCDCTHGASDANLIADRNLRRGRQRSFRTLEFPSGLVPKTLKTFVVLLSSSTNTPGNTANEECIPFPKILAATVQNLVARYLRVPVSDLSTTASFHILPNSLHVVILSLDAIILGYDSFLKHK
jgi:hypothetical protein